MRILEWTQILNTRRGADGGHSPSAPNCSECNSNGGLADEGYKKGCEYHRDDILQNTHSIISINPKTSFQLSNNTPKPQPRQSPRRTTKLMSFAALMLASQLLAGRISYSTKVQTMPNDHTNSGILALPQVKRAKRTKH